MIPKIIINKNKKLQDALIKLDANPEMQTLFVEDNLKIIGSITDGDIRRGLINGLGNDNLVSDFMNTNFTYLIKGNYSNKKIEFIKKNKLKIIPVLNSDFQLFRIINFSKIKTILPIDAVIMAGGVGSRLMPLTKDTPKPLLKIGKKPIMDYNIELLKKYGVSHITLSVNYLSHLIENYYKDGKHLELNISYIHENKPLGTIGAVKQIKDFYNDYVLVMNSDLLTNINLEAMFYELISNNADAIIASTDYQVQIPYGIIETNKTNVLALVEKPTYTYHSNAGIYIFKKEMFNLIPKDTHFNATDLLEKGISLHKKILNYSIKSYWLDIGKHNDFEKAQKDIHNIRFI